MPFICYSYSKHRPRIDVHATAPGQLEGTFRSCGGLNTLPCKGVSGDARAET